MIPILAALFALAVPLGLLAQLAADPDPILAAAGAILEAVVRGEWWVAAAAAVGLLSLAVRRWGASWWKPLGSVPGTIGTTFGLSVLGGLVNVALATGTWPSFSVDLLLAMVRIGLAAAGGAAILPALWAWWKGRGPGGAASALCPVGLLLLGGAIVASPGVAAPQATVTPSPPNLDAIKGRLGALESVVRSSKQLTLTDDAANAGRVVEIYHQGAGSTQAYGIDISNRADNASAPTPGTGAGSAIVVHNYSDYQPAVVLDNTRSKSLLRLRNAHNDSHSKGTFGTGSFIDFWGYSGNAVYPANPMMLGEINQNLGFFSHDSTRPWTFASKTSAASLVIAKEAGVSGKALVIDHVGKDSALHIDNKTGGTGSAIAIIHDTPTIAFALTANAASAGFWPIRVSGQNYGPKFITDTNSGQSLTVEKNGTGAGEAVYVVNKGTGSSVSIRTASAEVARVASDGRAMFNGVQVSTTGGKPSCASSTRGLFWHTSAAAGTKDAVEVCAKDASDAYAWRTIY